MKWLKQRGILFWFFVAWIVSFGGAGIIIFGMIASSAGMQLFGGGAPDLKVTMTDSPDPVKAGENLTYTIAFENAGKGEATAVVVSDTLPSGVTFVSSMPGTPACKYSDGTLTCRLGTQAEGGGGKVDIVVKVDSATKGAITNTATITGEEEEEDTTNNKASETTMVN